MRSALRSGLLAWLAGFVVVGCSAVPGTTAPTTTGGASAAVVATTKATPTSPTSTPRATPSPAPATPNTADDAAIADAIRAGVAEAIPELERLNKMDPSSQVKLFEPLGAWIDRQQQAVAASSAGGCAAEAVELFLDGLDAYDDIRERFLAWKDWGAHGRAYPPGAPREIATTLKQATAALEASCPG